MLVEKRVAAFAMPPVYPWRRRRIAVLTACAAFLVSAALLGIARGTVPIPLGNVVAMLAGGVMSLRENPSSCARLVKRTRRTASSG